MAELEKSVRAAAGGQVEMHARSLPSGETALLMLAAGGAAKQLEGLLSAARLDELPAPRGLGESNLLRAMPALRDRLAALEAERRADDARRADIAAAERPELEALQAQLHDLLLLAEAQAQVRSGELLFVIEGWMPEPALAPLRARVARELGPEVVVAKVATQAWTRGDAPVALANPRLFQPFELITGAFPLPRYGSIDPTPFIAVFFPMFFGLMLGDVGYGLLLAVIAAVLRWRSRPAGKVRAVAEMALGCALFTIVFGVLFGEFFGTLGATFGMRPLAFDRENALAPFLMFTIALGAVHVVLGLVLAVIGAWRQGQRRQALGRGPARTQARCAAQGGRRQRGGAMIGGGPAKVTRSSLMRLAHRLEQVEKGAALLERKRDALVLQLFARVRPSIEARRHTEQQAAQAYRALLDALAAAGRSELATIGWPGRDPHVEPLPPAQAAGVPAADRFAALPTLVRSASARGMVPGQFEPAAGQAAQAFERLLELVLATAPEEFAILRLGRALAHTVRQVNVLEQRVAVDLARARVRVLRTLDEREREEAVRLRRIAARARR